MARVAGCIQKGKVVIAVLSAVICDKRKNDKEEVLDERNNE
jgi:hypothetical protein